MAAIGSGGSSAPKMLALTLQSDGSFWPMSSVIGSAPARKLSEDKLPSTAMVHNGLEMTIRHRGGRAGGQAKLLGISCQFVQVAIA
jgi:hypothetical protein